MLIDYFSENQIPYADLYRGMLDEQGNLHKSYAYADGLHFSEEGYQQMGTVLFEDAVKPLIRRHYDEFEIF